MRKNTAQRIIENDHKIKKYECCYLDDSNIARQIFNGLKTNTFVSVVDLSNQQAHPFLADCIGENKGIQKLIINRSTTLLWQELMVKMKPNKTLKEIYLEQDHIGPMFEINLEAMQSFTHFLTNNPNFITLSLRSINSNIVINKAAFSELIKGLSYSTIQTLYIESINIDADSRHELLRLFATSKSLCKVSLRNVGLTDDNLVEFSNYVPLIKKKKILACYKNDITPIGLKPLANAIIQNPKLYILYGYKRDNGTLFRFETEYITPVLNRDWMKETKSWQHCF